MVTIVVGLQVEVEGRTLAEVEAEVMGQPRGAVGRRWRPRWPRWRRRRGRGGAGSAVSGVAVVAGSAGASWWWSVKQKG